MIMIVRRVLGVVCMPVKLRIYGRFWCSLAICISRKCVV